MNTKTIKKYLPLAAIAAGCLYVINKGHVISGVGAPRRRRGLRIRRNNGVGLTVTKEMDFSEYEPWSGAEYRYNMLTSDELSTIESMLEDLYPDGIDETQLNDFFWFEDDTIAEWLGYEDWEDLEKNR